MHEQKFNALKVALLEAGVAPKYVKRTLRELQDHYLDIKTGLLQQGMTEQDAAVQAEQQLGDLQNIAERTIERKGCFPLFPCIQNCSSWLRLCCGICWLRSSES